EVPSDTTTYLLSDLNSAHAETEAMQDSSVLSISGTINCVKPCIKIIRDGGVNGSIKMRHRVGSTDTDLSAFPTSSVYSLIAAVLSLDPATGLAWTTSGLDGV